MCLHKVLCGGSVHPQNIQAHDSGVYEYPINEAQCPDQLVLSPYWLASELKMNEHLSL